MIVAEPWARGDALLGEAPRLVDLTGDGPRLHWTDLLRGTVLARAEDGTAVVVRTFEGETASALLPLRDGRVAVALRRRIVVLDSGEAVGEVPLDLPAGMRLSDATPGPSGHLWVGVVADEGHAGPGSLLRVGPDGASIALPDVGFSNGLGFRTDGRALFHIDSTAGTVAALPHDPGTGAVGEPVVLHRHEGDGAMDGLAVDEHDRLWIAVFGAGKIVCVATDGPRRGEIVQEVRVPAHRVTSCCFDAEGALCITTARVDASSDELAGDPLAGSVFRAATGCSGAPQYEGNPIA